MGNSFKLIQQNVHSTIDATSIQYIEMQNIHTKNISSFLELKRKS